MDTRFIILMIIIAIVHFTVGFRGLFLTHEYCEQEICANSKEELHRLLIEDNSGYLIYNRRIK